MPGRARSRRSGAASLQGAARRQAWHRKVAPSRGSRWVRESPQPVECHADKPANGRLRREVGSGLKRVDAVGCQLFGRDVIANDSAVHPIGDDLADQNADLLERGCHVLVAVQRRSKVLVVIPVRLVRQQGERLEHGIEPAVRLGAISNVSQLPEVRGDPTLVPGDQHRLDVREVPILLLEVVVAGGEEAGIGQVVFAGQ